MKPFLLAVTYGESGGMKFSSTILENIWVNVLKGIESCLRVKLNKKEQDKQGLVPDSVMSAATKARIKKIVKPVIACYHTLLFC